MFHSGKKETKLYDILGVSSSATESEIKKAYRKKAMRYHPDKSNDSNRVSNEEKFKAISHAYDILKDSEKRGKYDQFGEEGLQGMSGFDGADPFDIFQNFFGGGMGGMGGNPFGFSTSSRRSRKMRRAEDRVEEINIDLEDVYNNVSKKIDLKQRVKCMSCMGSGAQAESDIMTCNICQGTGKMMRIINIGPGMMQQSVTTCDKCKGEGKIIKRKCLKCQGKKVEFKKKVINLPIESDFRDGKKIVIPNMAHYDPDCEEQGDLVLIIRLIEHEVFKMKPNHKYDLIMEKNILLSEALCGSNFMISHLDGREILIQTKDVIKPNMEYVIPEEGLVINNFEKGDLIINFNIIFPNKLDSERKKYLGKLLPVNPEAITRVPENFSGEVKKIVCQGEKINLEEVNLNQESNFHSGRQDNFPPGSSEKVECVQQ